MKNVWKIFWGIFFVLGAVYLIVSQIFKLPEISAFTVILTVFLLSIVIQGIRRLNFFFILFGLALIGCLYDKLLGIEALTPWTLLGAAFLGSIGLSLLLKNKKKVAWKKREVSFGRNAGVTEEYCFDDSQKFENNFSTVSRYINSDNFCSAELENNFGTMTVYFDNAIIQNPTAYLRVENNFGTINLYIPKVWKVERQTGWMLGKVMEKGRWEGTSGHTLCIRAETNFGAIIIYYV